MVPCRTLVALFLAAACGVVERPGYAEQLIQIPTAERARGARGEYLYRPGAGGEGYGSLLLPVGQAHELLIRYYDGLDRSHNIEAGGMFQLLPDGIVTPGIAAGLWDVTNSGPWGRRGFLVLTKGAEQGQFGLPRLVRRAELTLGLGTGRLGPVLAGVAVELPWRARLVAEYDARRLNAGLEFRPIRPLSLKTQLQNGNFFFGGDLTVHF